MAIQEILRLEGGNIPNNQDSFVNDVGGGGGGGNYTPPTNPIPENQSLFVNLAISSTPKDAMIVIDGNETNQLAPSTITFAEKELLTPKTISVKKSGNQSGDVYKVYTVYKEIRKSIEEPVPFDDSINEYTYRRDPENPGAVIREKVERPKVYTNVTYFPFYELIVEKLVDGQYIQQTKLESKYGDKQATLNTSLTFDIKSTPVYTEPIPTAKGKITINGDVYQNDLIEYRTTDGRVGLVTRGTIELDFSPNSSGGNNIQFISKGLNYKHIQLLIRLIKMVM